VAIELPGFASHSTRPLKAFSVHTPTKAASNYICEAQKILAFLKEQAGAADLIVGGDFNFTISKRIAGEMTPQSTLELDLIEYMEQTIGLVNCWQAMNPDTRLPRTFHSRDTSTGHLDGIFVSKRLWHHLVACEIRGEQHSWTEGDHYPVVAEFDDVTPGFTRRPARQASSPVEAR
jgi:endonuclease/exonuclease/phosphatase family metal-dependent hydrolase